MSKRDLIEYLEEKIHDGTIKDDEYGVYIHYRKHDVFPTDIHKIYRRLKKEYKEIYERKNWK